ncbi:unnamed protein product [Hymenolepis diminuta]|uniref:Golgi to er traffic protein 4 n=1 Tax=Hymenolepis diminuta TaxID=6216 RepID=A0A0R3SDV4_HYMDI|nr:unnamed protein product [Hymenolepis diminuta]VUZ53018.1 unnamed protein product [Hymenolepis diminuta]
MKSRLKQRIQAAKDEKRFYEAHQLYKSAYYRSSLHKTDADVLEDLLDGVKFFLDNQQWECGSDLACICVDVIVKNQKPITDSLLKCLCQFTAAMPSTCTDRLKFITKCLSLLKRDKVKLSAFNEFLGRQLLKEGALSQARNRIMLAGDGYKVGRFLIEFHQLHGLFSEIDLFVTQAVLQFLCAKKAAVAALTFYTYTRNHPKLEAGPPFSHFPLLNFVWLLMLAIDRKLGYDVLSFLCNQYRSQLMRDPTYAEYIDKISQLYFGVRKQNDPFNGLMSNIMRIFGDESSGELISDESPASRSGQSTSSPISMLFDDID